MLAAALVGAGFAGQAVAAGFELHEQNASGLGMAYSGMAAAVQDASTVFWNPAGMSRLPGRQIAASVNYIMPDTKFNSSGPPPFGSTFNAFGNGGQGGVSAWVPALYGTWMIDPRWSVGLAINVPFGLSTEWDSTWAGMFYAIKSKIETVNINPTVSFKVNNMLSLGAGVSYQRLKATLTNGVTPLVPSIQGKVEGDDWSWGWNVGALFDFGQGTRVGLTYRSTISYTVEGTLTFNSPAFAALQLERQGDIKLPHTVSIAVSHQFDRQLAGPRRLHLDRLGFDPESQHRADERVAVRDDRVKRPFNFKNSWRAVRASSTRSTSRGSSARASRTTRLRSRTSTARPDCPTQTARGFRSVRDTSRAPVVARLRLHVYLDASNASSNLTSPVVAAGQSDRQVQGQHQHPRRSGFVQVLSAPASSDTRSRKGTVPPVPLSFPRSNQVQTAQATCALDPVRKARHHFRRGRHRVLDGPRQLARAQRLRGARMAGFVALHRCDHRSRTGV